MKVHLRIFIFQRKATELFSTHVSQMCIKPEIVFQCFVHYRHRGNYSSGVGNLLKLSWFLFNHLRHVSENSVYNHLLNCIYCLGTFHHSSLCSNVVLTPFFEKIRKPACAICIIMIYVHDCFWRDPTTVRQFLRGTHSPIFYEISSS